MAAPSRTRTDVAVRGTTLFVERRGTGAPLLLVHGAGEDAAMLSGQADALAAAGFGVVSYDRRGTGRSGRDGWPGGGAAAHADDAADLVRALGLGPVHVLGLSSGGVVALELARRHPDVVGPVVAWEPPATGVLPDGEALTTALMAPVEAHLAAAPGDWVGAQAVLLTALAGFPVDRDTPGLDAVRANAEPMVRDDPWVTLARFGPGDLAGRDVTVALGDAPNEIVAAAAHALAGLLGRPAVRLRGGHEVYLEDPSVLAALLARTGPA